MIFKLIKAIALGASIGKDMPRRVNEKAEIAVELSREPLQDLLRSRRKAIANQTPPGPASPEQLELASRRLGMRIPAALLSLYAQSNGVLESDEPLMLQTVVPVDALARASSFAVKPSDRANADWNSWGREQGEPLAFRISDVSWEGLLGAKVLSEMPLNAFDEQLVIRMRGDTPSAVLLTEPIADLPAGSVVALENLRGTHFESLAHWLAFDLAELSVRSHKEVLGKNG